MKEKNVKTRDAVQDIIAITRTAQRKDLEAFQLLMPDNLEDAQRMISTACAILDAITTGPRQEQLFAEMASHAEDFGERELP
jgi:hypothetical protein